MKKQTMKSLTKVMFILCLSLTSTQVFSQISIGGQASFLNLFGGSGIKSIGLGLKGEYATSDKTVITGGFNYYLPSTQSTFTYGNAYSSTTDPSQIEIDVDYKVSFIHLYIGGKRYFAGDYEADFGFYGIAEAGLLLAPTTTSLGSYNETLYSTTMEDGEKETLGNFTLNFGVGVEKNLGFGYIFSDLKLILPANEANGQAVSFDIPASASISAGVRFPF